MKKIQLFEKIESIKGISLFQQKLVLSIHNIMTMKRNAENLYKTSLEAINLELEKYIQEENGFLIEIVKAFQSYITIIYQNQATLIEGYDNEILECLAKSMNSKVEQELIKKVQMFDQSIVQYQDKIAQTKRLLKDNEIQLQLISSEAKLGTKIGAITDSELKKLQVKYKDRQTSKKLNEEALEQQVDCMMELTMTHNSILMELQEYETIYLENKAADTFDTFMRVFVLQVSFIRSMQFDVGTILQRVKEKQEQHKKVAMDTFRTRMKKEITNGGKLKNLLWGTYKKLTQSYLYQINENYISDRIKHKWIRVCQYYNSAN